MGLNCIPLPNTATGGAVGGASNLVTVGSLTYVSATGVLNQATSLVVSGAGTTAEALTVYNSIASGVTKLTVKAGAGQSSTNLQEWQNSSGTVLASISSSGIANLARLDISSVAALNLSGTDLQLGYGSNTSFLLRGAGSFRLNFGGITSAEPSLKRSTTGLIARLADDSADTWVQASQFRSTLTTPASAADTGVTGTIVADTNFIYVCTATNTWKRVAIASW